MNTLQAQIEKTININMSAQTILTKFPRKIQTGMTSSLSQSANNGVDENDYDLFFKPVIDYVSY